jgi:hypothetical protein
MCNGHEPSTSQIHQRVLYKVDVFSVTTFYILLLKSHSFQDRIIPDNDTCDVYCPGMGDVNSLVSYISEQYYLPGHDVV